MDCAPVSKYSKLYAIEKLEGSFCLHSCIVLHAEFACASYRVEKLHFTTVIQLNDMSNRTDGPVKLSIASMTSIIHFPLTFPINVTKHSLTSFLTFAIPFRSRFHSVSTYAPNILPIRCSSLSRQLISHFSHWRYSCTIHCFIVKTLGLWFGALEARSRL